MILLELSSPVFLFDDEENFLAWSKIIICVSYDIRNLSGLEAGGTPIMFQLGRISFFSSPASPDFDEVESLDQKFPLPRKEKEGIGLLNLPFAKKQEQVLSLISCLVLLVVLVKGWQKFSWAVPLKDCITNCGSCMPWVAYCFLVSCLHYF